MVQSDVPSSSLAETLGVCVSGRAELCRLLSAILHASCAESAEMSFLICFTQKLKTCSEIDVTRCEYVILKEKTSFNVGCVMCGYAVKGANSANSIQGSSTDLFIDQYVCPRHMQHGSYN